MFVICNRIPVAKGHEAEFEKLFLDRDDSKSQHPLKSFPGFIRNDILRPTKEEPYVANARSVHLADGRQVFAGSSFDTGPTAGEPAPAD